MRGRGYSFIFNCGLIVILKLSYILILLFFFIGVIIGVVYLLVVIFLIIFLVFSFFNVFFIVGLRVNVIGRVF